MRIGTVNSIMASPADWQAWAFASARSPGGRPEGIVERLGISREACSAC